MEASRLEAEAHKLKKQQSEMSEEEQLKHIMELSRQESLKK